MSAPNGARFQTPTLRADYASVHVDCPAKTNLTLHVGERREEWGGRHALETIYCGVGIYDTVTVTAKEPGTGFSSISPALIWEIWPRRRAICAGTTPCLPCSRWRRPAGTNLTSPLA